MRNLWAANTSTLEPTDKHKLVHIFFLFFCLHRNPFRNTIKYIWIYKWYIVRTTTSAHTARFHFNSNLFIFVRRTKCVKDNVPQTICQLIDLICTGDSRFTHSQPSPVTFIAFVLIFFYFCFILITLARASGLHSPVHSGTLQVNAMQFGCRKERIVNTQHGIAYMPKRARNVRKNKKAMRK